MGLEYVSRWMAGVSCVICTCDPRSITYIYIYPLPNNRCNGLLCTACAQRRNDRSAAQRSIEPRARMHF